MSCDRSSESLLDYLYEEMSDEQRLEFADHIQQCQTCRKELASLNVTSDILKSWQDEESNLKLKFLEPKLHRSLRLPQWRTMRRFVFAAAVSAGFLITLSLLNFKATYTDGTLTVHMGVLPETKTDVSENQDISTTPVTRVEFTQWQQESYDLMMTLLQQSETEQSRRYSTILTNFASDIEAQRQQDLRFVGQGLEVFRWSNQREIRRSNQALQQLILTSAQARSSQTTE